MSRKNSAVAEPPQGLLLRPEKPLVPDNHGTIDPDAIAHEECFVSEELTKNICAYGVTEPVILTGQNPYTIIEGRRRVKIAKVHKLKEIPFVHFDDMAEGLRYALGLSIPWLRSENLFATIENMERIVEKEGSAGHIANALGMPIKQVQKRMKLLDLDRRLRVGLLDNSIPDHVALKACLFTKDEQEQLVAIYEANDKLTWVDLATVRPSKSKGAAQEALPLDLNPLQKSAAKLIGFLGDARDRLGEDVSHSIYNIFNGIACFAEQLADEKLNQPSAETMREAVAEFRAAYEGVPGQSAEIPGEEDQGDDASFTFETPEPVEVRVVAEGGGIHRVTFKGPVSASGEVVQRVAKREFGKDREGWLKKRAIEFARGFAGAGE
ncbi:MAG TPA: ParB N-terminal domain-containing protein [Fimbriimonas sp.]|nr:ParB N-terminal domain-containing protein [Fimbriimonas sp.]